MEAATPAFVRAGRQAVLGLALTAAAVVGLAAREAAPQAERPAGKDAVPTVLFMCPHGAAKSVLASAHFQQAAKKRGLNVRVESAGTEPDPEVAPAVVRHLKANGHDVPTGKPRRATAADMANADVVVSIGCDLSGLPAPRGRVVRWDDVPSPGENLALADEKIRERVIELVDELVRQRRR